MSILDTIVKHKKQEVELLKRNKRYSDFESSEYFYNKCISLSDRLRSDFGIIAEMKRKSPSAGVIHGNLDVAAQGKAYEDAGAAGISCLTDQQFFGGSINDLSELRKHVNIPILRKEFIIDELQLFEAKAAGADVVLLISEILTKQEALHLTIIAQSLGLEVIMEFHSRESLRKLNDFVDIVGINNRDLHRQETSVQKSFDLVNYIPEDRCKISESGIYMAEQIEALKGVDFHGALIGEHILRSNEPKESIRELLNQPVYAR